MRASGTDYNGLFGEHPCVASVFVEASFTFAVLAYVAALAIYLKDVFAVNDGLRFMHDSIGAALEARRRRGP